MADRELLELAAKAAGIEGIYDEGLDGLVMFDCECTPSIWRPHTDGGDALRLAVRLGININFGDGGEGTVIAFDFTGRFEDCEECGDPLIATCRAIVRAAAEIGRSME